MLKLVAFDTENDSAQLKRSYDLIQHKDSLEIVTSVGEQNTILLKVKYALTIPESATLKFQNLFKLTLPNGQFYIAQCLINFGPSGRNNEPKYRFQIAGVADIRINLRKTLMRPETRTDKTVGRLFGSDIDLDDTKQFNDKYYLASNAPEMITKHFDKDFLNTISRYDNLLMIALDKEMVITFDSEFKAEHSRIVEDIFSNCKFLVPNFGLK